MRTRETNQNFDVSRFRISELERTEIWSRFHSIFAKRPTLELTPAATEFFLFPHRDRFYGISKRDRNRVLSGTSLIVLKLYARVYPIKSCITSTWKSRMESMDRESRNIGGFMYGVAWTYLSIAASTISLEYISTLSFEEDLSDYRAHTRSYDIYVYTYTYYTYYIYIYNCCFINLKRWKNKNNYSFMLHVQLV